MNKTEQNYVKAREQFESAETDLARAQNRWQKARAKMKRYEKRLDKALLHPRTLDWQDIARDEMTVIETERPRP